jgi:hypothetical protein
MDGPEIIAHTFSQPSVPDKNGNSWQYKSRSDRHSKVVCWALLFDLLQHCSLLRQHIESGKVVFSLGQKMYDHESGGDKKLDLVLAVPGQRGSRPERASTLQDLALQWSVRIGEEQQRVLADLPKITDGPVGEILVAVEVKACMTQHKRAFPRLLNELSASHAAIHGDTDSALAVGLAIVNASTTFVSPGRNNDDLSVVDVEVNQHRQPGDAAYAIEKLEQVRQRSGARRHGYDAFGIVAVDMANDGSPVNVVRHRPAPEPDSTFFYDQVIRRVGERYGDAFSGLT